MSGKGDPQNAGDIEDDSLVEDQINEPTTRTGNATSRTRPTVSQATTVRRDPGPRRARPLDFYDANPGWGAAHSILRFESQAEHGPNPTRRGDFVDDIDPPDYEEELHAKEDEDWEDEELQQRMIERVAQDNQDDEEEDQQIDDQTPESRARKSEEDDDEHNGEQTGYDGP